MITTFADCPQVMQAFCFRWNIPQPNTRACAIICSVCKGLLPMCLVSDVIIEAQDAQALLVLELEQRGWKIIEKGRPVCPNCQLG